MSFWGILGCVFCGYCAAGFKLWYDRDKHYRRVDKWLLINTFPIPDDARDFFLSDGISVSSIRFNLEYNKKGEIIYYSFNKNRVAKYWLPKPVFTEN